jgi:hypothetical protein
VKLDQKVTGICPTGAVAGRIETIGECCTWLLSRPCVWSRGDPVAQPGSAAVDPFRADHNPARPAANQSVLPVPPKCAPGRPP